jgi:hypothetical protein
MSRIKCVDVMHLSYLQTYNDSFCLSRKIATDGSSLIELEEIDGLYVYNDQVEFFGDSLKIFLMTLVADNYHRTIHIKFQLQLEKIELVQVLKALNELNALGYAASASYDEEANNVVVQSSVQLLGYGLVIEDNNSPDDHTGLAYAVEVTKEQILSTARMASRAVREFENLGCLSTKV